MFSKIKEGLKKTREALAGKMAEIFSSSQPTDDATIESLEELLLSADVGLSTINTLLDRLPKDARKSGATLKQALRERMMAFWTEPPPPEGPPPKPWVNLMVGVNGVGKTTTIGKLAAQRTSAGQAGVIAAADTFRAAAVEQLAIWAERAGATLVSQKEGADPAAVAFDAVQSAVAKGSHFVLVDTAGRLHVKHNLMEELAKVHRVVGKAMPGSPHSVTLVLDATTGQNGLNQARMFLEKVPVTDLVLTKLDGTAKVGIALSIASELKIPIRYVGVGEKIDDLVPFSPAEYVDGILS